MKKKNEQEQLTATEELVLEAAPLLQEAFEMSVGLITAALALEKKLQMQNRRLGYIARYYPDVHQDALKNAGKEEI